VPEALSPAVFIDRDGTLMRDVDYCGDPNEVAVFDAVPPALQRLKAAGYKVIVITNQSGIGRGYFNEKAYRAVEAELERQIGAGLIDATYFCPHSPTDRCECRKPEPALVFQAAREHSIDLARSYFVGDKDSDIQCGRRAGTRTILVQTGYGGDADEKAADGVVSDLAAAVRIILKPAAA
jgi:D-glycero-D-manno-heptose 1,7-bisphosphate phosphatase